MWRAGLTIAAFVAILAAEQRVLAAATGVCPRIVPRDDWGARLPKSVQEMHNPVSTVVIHHTYSPSACLTAEDCEAKMRGMQKYHMDDRGWVDIGYSFAVGGDGRVYKGRGWNSVGAHAPPYNADSIGITLIGDWSDETPPEVMLETTKWLIQCGVQTGRISPDYQLIGHRQARDTECPGAALYAAIQKWDRWTDKPVPPRFRPGLDAALAVSETPVVVELTYDPATPSPEQVELDAIEVRQLNKRSLWDRLVHIWQQEAVRRARLAEREGFPDDAS